ncbi:RsmB/NOP family class I SAM-dependent RNA methyltransferase [Campylobacter sp. CCS1377]|uniref:RsmB/NOP family class I SAM-dependent RNA methyltransferase n=1 Tax=Campylobacter sp. CCS1377 TaxID=3158229 RepID=A0AAU7E8P1_9BACT
MALFDLKTHLDGLYDEKQVLDILESFDKPKDICVFINTLKSNELDFEELLKQVDIAFVKLDKYCYKIDHKDKNTLTRLKAFELGYFYVQNYSSYLCAKNLNVKPNESVLDMCAAPGGKSINLANFMENQGYLACVEASKDRFFVLKKNLQNYGVKIAKCFLKDAKSIGKICPSKFDKILLDAPCSTFAKSGFLIQKNLKEIKQISNLQKRLLNSALKALKQDGELIYSTCTFTRYENEEVLENALNGEIKIEILDLNLDKIEAVAAKSSEFDALKKAKRILPNNLNDGFFICKIKKKSL